MAKLKSDDSPPGLRKCVTEPIKSTPIKKFKHTERKVKIRPLVKADSIKPAAEEKESKTNKETEVPTRSTWKYLVGALVVLVIAVPLSNLVTSRCGFWTTYLNNYNKIVHGDERFCHRQLDSLPILEKLREQVIAQEDALKLIGASLELANRERIIQIALIGPVGTGKTLTASIISENFKWQRNVVSLIYDLNFRKDLSDQEVEEDDFRVATSRFSDCGFNLIVIDNVDTDESAIERMTSLERSLHRLAKQKLHKIVLIVIFKRNLSPSAAQERLNHFVIVEFAAFTEKSFEQCIRAHEKLHSLKLSTKDIDELKLINFTHSGCKTLAKKLNLVQNE